MKTYDEISDAAKDRGAFVHGEKPTEGRVHYRVGFIDGAKWMQEQDQWIPVTERLPSLRGVRKDKNWKFLVSNKEDEWVDAAYFNINGIWHNGECEITPTH